MIIANIISDVDINISKEFNVVKSFDMIINELPTLIVGWEKANSLFPNNNVLTRNIDEKTFWTLSKKENRDCFEEDLFKFKEFCFNRLVEKFEYMFINPIEQSFSTIKEILGDIIFTSDSIAMLTTNMIYILTDIKIYGINLEFIEYVGFDIVLNLSNLLI
jgi:hypothetical protein